MTHRKKHSKTKPRKKKTVKSYPFEFRLRVVKLYLEEGYSAPILHEELGVSKSCIRNWVKKFREAGEKGLP